MKTPSRRGLAAFTLIEMMTVITIIIILASIVIGSMAFVRERQAKEKAKVQLGLLAKAIEDYKHDNGTYPPTNDTATPNGTPTKDTGNTDILFKALYYDGALDTTKKIYISQLDPAMNKQGWTSGTAGTTTRIYDPWGHEFRYRTATNATGGANGSTQNPDFDLWSVGKDGKTNDNPKDKDCRDDIRNF